MKMTPEDARQLVNNMINTHEPDKMSGGYQVSTSVFGEVILSHGGGSMAVYLEHYKDDNKGKERARKVKNTADFLISLGNRIMEDLK